MDLAERGNGTARHPWEVARAEHFRRLADEARPLGATRHVLDIGAGDGWFADEIAPSLPTDASIVCWDVNYEAAQLDAPTTRVSRTATRPDERFELVFLLDVLEHVDDDEAFLADEVVPVLAGDATLIVSVPAHPRLFSAHDEFLHHHRRYRPAAFVELLRRHVDVDVDGSLFTSLVAPRVVQVAAERVGRRPAQHGVGAWRGGPRLTRVVTGGLQTDARTGAWLARHGAHLPGLSHWAVCRPRRT